MSHGEGVAPAWGGDPLTSVDDPRRAYGSLPYSFDFTDEPDGPLPGRWELFQYEDDGGVLTGKAEPLPSFYEVQGGLGVWRYSRTPAGPLFIEQGVAASPSGVITTTGARALVVFLSPLSILDHSQDNLRVEIAVGLRASASADVFRGGRVRAVWDRALGWTVPLAVDAVAMTNGALASLGSAPIPPSNKSLDHWETSAIHSLSVEVVDEEMKVSFDDVISISVNVPRISSTKPVLYAKVYHQIGASVTPVPIFLGMELKALQESEFRGPLDELWGDQRCYDAPSYPPVALPLGDLERDGLFVRKSSRVWEAKTDVQTTVDGVGRVWPKGTRVRAQERYADQLLVPVSVDLRAVRAAKRHD